MTRTAYYERLKRLARQVRAANGIITPRVLKSDLRRIYRKEGIRIDIWDRKFRHLRGAYFNDDLGPTVMLVKGPPPEPMIFTMAHELKHHLVDRAVALSPCDPRALGREERSSENEPIEIGAEVFAAELIFPEPDFAAAMTELHIGLGECTPEALIRVRQHTRTTMSYAALAKRSEFLRYAPSGSLGKIKWKKLEEELLGEPVYKKVQRARRRRLLRNG
jgi:Zn-dependent peptidase ImmA (M78 family)